MFSALVLFPQAFCWRLSSRISRKPPGLPGCLSNPGASVHPCPPLSLGSENNYRFFNLFNILLVVGMEWQLPGFGHETRNQKSPCKIFKTSVQFKSNNNIRQIPEYTSLIFLSLLLEFTFFWSYCSNFREIFLMFSFTEFFIYVLIF